MKLRSLVVSVGVLQSLLCANALAQMSTTWTAPGSWGAAGFARAGDFNGDGKTDIVSPYGADARMKISTGSGFTAESWVIDGGTTSWGDAEDVLVGDFDCNGKDDIVQVKKYPPANYPNVDIKFSGFNTFTTSVWTISGLPFGVPGAIEPLWGADGFVFVGNFDNDNCRDDIITLGVQGTSSHAHVLQGKMGNNETFPSAGFRFYEVATNTSAGSPPWTLVGDFNNDGRDDIASANGSNAYMSFSVISGNGFPPSILQNWTTATWTVSGSWGTANYARASRPGLSSIYSPQGGTVYLKGPTGSSFTSTTLSVTNAWGAAQWTFMGDFDGNGTKSDIASANGSNVYMKFF